MTPVETMAGEILAKRTTLAGYYKNRLADGRFDLSDAQRGEIKSLNDELNVIVPRYEKIRGDEAADAANRKALEDLRAPILPPGFHGTLGQGDARGHDGAGVGRRGQVLQLGDLFVGSGSYKGFAEARHKGESPRAEFAGSFDAEIKTLFSTTAGYDPYVARLPGLALSAQQMPRVVDLIPQAETSSHAIRWMLETLFTNNAAEVAEAGQYPESAFACVEQLTPVQKVAHFVPVTDEALADTPGMRDYLNGRLELGLKQRLDRQIMLGNGVSPNLKGINALTGLQVQALGVDVAQDAIFKAITKVQSIGFGDASAIILNPVDWQNIRLAKNGDGNYLWGSPDGTAAQRIWGLPVVTSTYCTQGTAFVGDFAMHSQLWYRKGIEFLVSNSHSDYFIKGIQAIRADMRVAFVVTRPEAFAKVTGLAA